MTPLRFVLFLSICLNLQPFRTDASANKRTGPSGGAITRSRDHSFDDKKFAEKVGYDRGNSQASDCENNFYREQIPSQVSHDCRLCCQEPTYSLIAWSRSPGERESLYISNWTQIMTKALQNSSEALGMNIGENNRLLADVWRPTEIRYYSLTKRRL